MTDRTVTNAGADVETEAGAAAPFGVARKIAAASASAAGTRARLLERSRPIMAWRTAPPATNSNKRISQFVERAYVVGSYLDCMCKSSGNVMELLCAHTRVARAP